MLSLPREVAAGRPRVTSIHRDFIPVPFNGVGHLGSSGIEGLSGSGPAERYECEKL